MRVERVIQDTGGSSVITCFHPGTTVVHGFEGSAIRFASSIIDAVCGDPDGVHVELHLGGRDIAVFRPDDEPHRVIDVDGAADISGEFVNVAGVIDLLVPLRVSRLRAEGAMLVTLEHAVEPAEAQGRRVRPLALVVAVVAAAGAALVAQSPVEVGIGMAAAVLALSVWLISGRRGSRSVPRPDTGAIGANVAAAQDATTGDDPLPVIIVDLFESLGPQDKPAALDAVIRASAGGQVIVVTNDADVIDLARFREMAGEVSVAAPALHYASPA